MKKQLLSIAIFSIFSSISHAAMTNDAFLKKIQKQNPKLNVERVEYLPELNLYEFVMKDAFYLSYTNENLDYFIIDGTVVNPATQNPIDKDKNPVLAKSHKTTPQENEFLKKIQQKLPQLNVTSVEFIPELHLYEFNVKGLSHRNYSNDKIEYMIIDGKIVDPVKSEAIEGKRNQFFVQRLYASLPKNDSIEVKYGPGTRGVAIFSDPLCPYCRISDVDIHETFKNGDLKINYFMNSLRIPGHEASPQIAKQIWCSPNKSKAWVEWMTNMSDDRKPPNNKGTCKNPVDSNKLLAQKFGLTETPVLIFDNGIIWTGQITAANVKEILAIPPLQTPPVKK